MADTSLPLSAKLPVVAARGGPDLVKHLFEPLGYAVTVEGGLLDELFPEWGESPCVSVEITAVKRLQDLLTHLYVLMCSSRSSIGRNTTGLGDEVEKLLKRGEGWLGQQPEKELIVSRYLKRQRHLAVRMWISELPPDFCNPSSLDRELLILRTYLSGSYQRLRRQETSQYPQYR